MYMSAIVDELGEFICFCEGRTEAEIDRILDEHPEWSIECIYIGG